MSRWGRGWEVSVRKHIERHDKTMEVAADILKQECGQRHPVGTRTDLCPRCIEHEPIKEFVIEHYPTTLGPAATNHYDVASALMVRLAGRIAEPFPGRTYVPSTVSMKDFAWQTRDAPTPDAIALREEVVRVVEQTPHPKNVRYEVLPVSRVELKNQFDTRHRVEKFTAIVVEIMCPIASKRVVIVRAE